MKDLIVPFKLFFRIYSIAVGNMTLNYTAWNTPELLDNLQVRMGEHSLHLVEGTQVDLGVEHIFGHLEYSR